MRKQAITTFFILLSGLVYSQQKAFEVKVTGEGKPIIFLPGFTCPGEVWDETVNQLGDGFQFYQFTYAGFGGVPPIGPPWYRPLSSALTDYLQKNQLEDAIIVGHSMGGMLAIELAANLPDYVGRVVLVDALPCIREVMMPNVKSEHIVYDNPYSRQMLEMSDSAFSQTAKMMAQGMANNSEKHELMTSWILTSDRKTYVHGFTDLLKLDLRDRLSSIKAPVLVMAADFPDREAVSKNINEQFMSLQNKEIRIAQSSKHFIMYDQPEWFYTEMKNFLLP